MEFRDKAKLKIKATGKYLNTHSEPLIFTVVTILSNFLPIISGILLDLAKGNWSWADCPNIGNGYFIYYKDGQSYLYAASLLTSSAYVYYTYKMKNTDFHSIKLLFTSLLILISSLLYAFLLTGNFVKTDFLKTTSVILFVSSTLFYYDSNYINSTKTIDLKKVEKSQIDDIKAQL